MKSGPWAEERRQPLGSWEQPLWQPAGKWDPVSTAALEANSADNPDASEHGELTDRSFEIRQLKEQKKKKDEKGYVNYGTPLSKQTLSIMGDPNEEKEKGKKFI